MTIRPVDLNGMIQRTDDVGYLKHNQDIKPMMDQQNIQVQVDKREDRLAHEIQEKDKLNNAKNDQDAKDEGQNSYFGNRSKKKDKKDGKNKVVKKYQSGSFDVKI